eukprot:scaffold48_cov395-Prasinococcus_capsulatus_cf.AAC.51
MCRYSRRTFTAPLILQARADSTLYRAARRARNTQTQDHAAKIGPQRISLRLCGGLGLEPAWSEPCHAILSSARTLPAWQRDAPSAPVHPSSHCHTSPVTPRLWAAPPTPRSRVGAPLLRDPRRRLRRSSGGDATAQSPERSRMFAPASGSGLRGANPP